MSRWGVALLAAVLGLGFAVSSASAAPQGLWAPPVDNVSAAGQSAGEPQVTSASDGTAIAVWLRFDGSNSIVQASTRPPGGTFGAPVNLSGSGQDAFGPQVAAAPDGTATVVWSRIDGAVARIQATTRPPGGSFGVPIDLSEPGEDAFNPQVTAAPDGTATVVWGRFDGTDNRVQSSTRPPGGSFGAPVNVSAPGQSAYGPQIATASNGTTTAVWSRDDGPDMVIQAATRPPGGSFGTPVDLSASGQDAQGQQVTVAPDGRTTAVWRSDDGSALTVQSSTRAPGGSFGAQVELSAPGQFAENPQVTAAPDGTTTAVWSSDDGADIQIQAATRPPGGSFGAPVDLSAPGQNAKDPQVAAAPDGTTTAVWWRDGGSDDSIQAATRRPVGSFGTPVEISDPGQIARAPQITAAPDGTATAVWERFNSVNFIIQSISTAPPVPTALSVNRTGKGSGKVTSTPAGIDCGNDCTESFPSFTQVTLTAKPGSGSAFNGWSGGGCSGTGDCLVTLEQATTVSAAFGKPKLANLAITPKSKKAKRGKNAVFKVKVRNTGDAIAKSLKLCTKGPKKLVKVPKCVKPGNLAAGKSRTVKVKVKVKKGAKKGKKAKLTFTATAAGGLKKSAKATVKVK